MSSTAGRGRAGSIACSSGRLIRNASLYSSRLRAGAVQRAGGLEDAQLEELPRVVPLVDRVRDVEPFVALQPDQIGLERGGDRAGERRLADAGLAFEKQRPAEPERQEERHREAVVGDVVLRASRCCRSVIEPRKVVVTPPSPYPYGCCPPAAGGVAGRGGRGGEVVRIHHGVEHHVELTVVLRAIDRDCWQTA